MALSDEQFRLILDLANNSKNVEELSAKIAAMGVGTERAAKLADEVWASNIRSLRNYVVTTEQATTATATLGRSTANAGMASLQASYAIQDFTSQLGTRGLAGALAAVQNNIPLILMNLGGPAGLVGLISVATVGAGLLYENYDKLAQLWGSGKTEEETQRLKDMGEQIEKNKTAMEGLLKTLRPEQREGAANLKKAVEAFGGKEVENAVKAALVREYGSFGDDSKLIHDKFTVAEALQAKLSPNSPIGQKVAAAMKGRIEPGADTAHARNLIANVLSGQPDAQAEMRKIMGAGQGGDIGQIITGGKTPDEQWKIQKKVLADQAKMMAEAPDKAKAKLDAENKIRQELTEQGIEQQLAGEERARADRRNVQQKQNRREAQQQQEALKRQREHFQETALEHKIDPGMQARLMARKEAVQRQGVMDLMNNLLPVSSNPQEFALQAQTLFNQNLMTQNQLRIAKLMALSRQIQMQQQNIPNVMSGFGP
jgi:hypothetical protein